MVPYRSSSHAGFTLIELLVATGIIAVLMTVVIVAVNPFRMFAAAQQTKRSSDVSTLGKSLDTYLISVKGVVPTQMYPLNTPKPIAKNSGGPEADLCGLLSPHIAGLPIDPNSPGNIVKDCTSTYSTGYSAVANSSGKIGVYSPTGISLVNQSGVNVAVYGQVPDEFITPPSTIMAFAAGTFTPALAKRTPPAGPFAAGVMVQGIQGANGTNDSITASHGTQVAGNFYQNFDGNQGSIVFWITPEWNGNDGLMHDLFETSGGPFLLRKHAANILQFYDGTNSFAGPSTTSWVPGSTYLVIVSWDSRNYLSGSSYVRFTVNNTHTFTGSSFTANTQGANLELGFRSGNTAADALIQGLTIYRRPLYEATTPSGINVGNGDEISQIYNSGTGRDPTLVTGSWDVVFALPTNASTGALGTTGEAWSHPHASNLLTDGFMQATYASSAWTNVGTQPLGTNWWLAGGVNPVNAVGVYQAKGAADYAASKVNLANPGTYDLTDGVAPTWASGTGWIFNGSQYLITGIVPVTTYSMIVRWTRSAFTYGWLAGSYYSATDKRFSLFLPGTGALIKEYGNGQYALPASSDALTSGVMAVTNVGYLNGALDFASPLTPFASFNLPIGIGIMNGFSTKFLGNIQATSIYNSTLTAAQVAAISAAMNGAIDMPATQKIFSGGYAHYATAANDGIKQVIATTAGSNYVIRGLAHSDGTSQPVLELYDETHGASIGKVTGTTTSTRTAPDVFIFTGQAPAGCTSISVRALNAASSGMTYWHQVEVLSNAVGNPSAETGSGTPWIPTGWINGSLTSGMSAQESIIVHSGSSSFKILNNSVGTGIYYDVSGETIGDYYAGGTYSYTSVGFNRLKDFNNAWFSGNGVTMNIDSSTAAWSLKEVVGRVGPNGNFRPGFRNDNGAAVTTYIDDFFAYKLNAVTLTLTPASLANSTEASGVRVDGGDTLIQANTAWTVNSGQALWNWTPRRSSANMMKFGQPNPYVAIFWYDANNFIALYFSAANTMVMQNVIGGSNGSVSGIDVTGLFTAGTTYALDLSYSAGGYLLFKVNGVTKATRSFIPAFTNAPNTIRWGANSGNDGADATFATTP
ncbi:MAG: prepilin-type N-terminal cleavage/methylation domain-containing protein [Candidatus Roizmanbacteria bacterium]